MDNKIICDRCGKECIEGSAYYTVDIYGHDIKPTNDGRVSFDAYVQNFVTNYTKLIKQQKHYCKKCKDEIEAFLKPIVKPSPDANVANKKENTYNVDIDEFLKEIRDKRFE